MNWLREFLMPNRGQHRLVRIADLMSEPEARMWQEALKQEGIPSIVKSLTGGAEPGYSLNDFSLWTTAENAERASALVTGPGEESCPNP
jgi:hypothetical protein